MNPLLNGTTPIYLGCQTIESYFGNIITLSKNVENDMNLIKNIINNPSEYKKDIHLEKVKDKIYLYRNLDKIFDVDE